MEAQPLGEPDQLLSLLHAPHLSTATLNDLGKGSSVTHPYSLPPFLLPDPLLTSPASASPAAHLADSTQGLLGILLAAGPLLCLVEDVLKTRRKGDWAPALRPWGSEGLQLRGPLPGLAECSRGSQGFRVHRAEEPASTKLRDLTAHCLPNPEQATLPL